MGWYPNKPGLLVGCRLGGLQAALASDIVAPVAHTITKTGKGFDSGAVWSAAVLQGHRIVCQYTRLTTRRCATNMSFFAPELVLNISAAKTGSSTMSNKPCMAATTSLMRVSSSMSCTSKEYGLGTS